MGSQVRRQGRSRPQGAHSRGLNPRSGGADSGDQGLLRYGNQAVQSQVSDAVDLDPDLFTSAVDHVMKVVPPADQGVALTHVTAILRQAVLLGVRNANQVAYLLATAEHESHFGNTRYSWSEPLVEDGNKISKRRDGRYHSKVHIKNKQISGATRDEAEERYWDTLYGGRLGNERGTSDGEDYRGRGYVQLTGRANYRAMSKRLNDVGFSYEHDGVRYGGDSGEAIDLEAHPTHVNEVPDLAARVLVKGAMEGTFIPGRSIPRYVNKPDEHNPLDQKTDFYDARSVINGDKRKNGRKIADAARRYAEALVGIWPFVFAPRR